jgi:hypothetical protein
MWYRQLVKKGTACGTVTKQSLTLSEQQKNRYVLPKQVMEKSRQEKQGCIL